MSMLCIATTVAQNKRSNSTAMLFHPMYCSIYTTLPFSLSFYPALPSSKSTLLPQPLPISPKQKRRRPSQPNSNKSEQTIPPPIIQRFIHIGRKKREPETRQTPQHSSSPNSTGRIPRIRINDIRLNTLEPDNHPGCKDRCADVREYPMCMCL